MLIGWALVKWVHILGAVVWLGGVFFVVNMLRPALAAVPEAQVRAFILGQAVTRMRRIMNPVIIIQVITGSLMTWVKLTGAGAFWATPWGWALITKVTLATFLVGLYFVVPRLLLAAAAAQATASSPAGDGCCSSHHSGGYGSSHEGPGPKAKAQQKLGHILHIVMLVLGFIMILLAQFL